MLLVALAFPSEEKTTSVLLLVLCSDPRPFLATQKVDSLYPSRPGISFSW